MWQARINLIGSHTSGKHFWAFLTKWEFSKPKFRLFLLESEDVSSDDLFHLDLFFDLFMKDLKC